MTIESLEKLFLDGLKDVYDMEKRLVKALPKMAESASLPELKTAIEAHLDQTNTQVGRLEEIFGALGAKPSAKTCAGIKGILEEGEEALTAEGPDELVDYSIICAARRAEHYEMAGYLALRDTAQSLGMSEAVKLLADTLQEEMEADEKLGELGSNLLDAFEATTSAREFEEDEDYVVEVEAEKVSEAGNMPPSRKKPASAKGERKRAAEAGKPRR